RPGHRHRLGRHHRRDGGWYPRRGRVGHGVRLAAHLRAVGGCPTAVGGLGPLAGAGLARRGRPRSPLAAPRWVPAGHSHRARRHRAAANRASAVYTYAPPLPPPSRPRQASPLPFLLVPPPPPRLRAT